MTIEIFFYVYKYRNLTSVMREYCLLKKQSIAEHLHLRINKLYLDHICNQQTK